MLEASVQQLIRQGLPQAELNDFRVEAVGPGFALVRQPFMASLIRPGGTLSGPTIMALADGAMYAAVLAAAGLEAMAVTQNLNFQFLSRPQPADLYARATILKMGSRAVHLAVSLYQQDESSPVAYATGSYALPLRPS